jgi:hypothetical protein
MVEVALGEPMVPVTCCAAAWPAIASEPARQRNVLATDRRNRMLNVSMFHSSLDRLPKLLNIKLHRPLAIRKAHCLICLKNNRLKLIINLKTAKALASMLGRTLLAS